MFCLLYTSYNSYAKRHHRWLRGDWQLLPWLFPKVKDAAGNTVENPLNFLSRWKIFDNLRRSRLPVAHLLMMLPFAGGFSLIALLSLLFPVLAQLFDDFLQKTYRNIKTKRYVTIVRGVWLSLIHISGEEPL